MQGLPILLLCGTAGGLFFLWLRLPGGAMVGAMLAVVLYNSFTGSAPVVIPKPLSAAVYICLGVTIGNMYQPGMLNLIRDTWPALLGSTIILLLAGLVSAWMVMRFGGLSIVGAYLATSPGGLNAVVGGLATQMGSEAPLVLIYHLVRIYTVLLLAPYGVKLIQFIVR